MGRILQLILRGNEPSVSVAESVVGKSVWKEATSRAQASSNELDAFREDGVVSIRSLGFQRGDAAVILNGHVFGTCHFTQQNKNRNHVFGWKSSTKILQIIFGNKSVISNSSNTCLCFCLN